MRSPFRAIRQKLFHEGKLLRYLSYAVGEILLIIIGIVIALQLNNWNEDRKAQKEFDEFVQYLKTDIQVAIATVERNIRFAEGSASGAASVFQMLQVDDLDSEQLAELESGLDNLGKYQELGIYNGRLGRLLNGDMAIIDRDPVLAEKAMELESRIRRRMAVVNHIYAKIDLAEQIFMEFRGASIQNLDTVMNYDLEAMRNSGKFQFTTQKVSSMTFSMSARFADTKEDLEEFLTVLEDYE